DVRARVEQLRRRARGLHELVALRRMIVGLVPERDELAVMTGGKDIRLPRLGAMPVRAPHLAPRQREAHRTADKLRCSRRERNVVPRLSLATEATADERVDH